MALFSIKNRISINICYFRVYNGRAFCIEKQYNVYEEYIAFAIKYD